MRLSNEEIQELIIEYQSKARKAEFQLAEYKKTMGELEKALMKPRSQRGKRATTSKATSITNTSATKARKRGRPRKAAAKATTATAKTTAKRKPGRPKKKTTTKTTTTAKRKPGRPRKSAAKTTAKATSTTRRKPGRPKKKTTAKAATSKAKARTKTTRKTTKAAGKSTKATGRKGGYRLNEWDELVLETLKNRQKVSVFSDFQERAEQKAKSENRKLDEKKLYSRINQSLHKLANKRGVLVKVPHEGRGYAYGMSEWKSPSGKGVKKQYQ